MKLTATLTPAPPGGGTTIGFAFRVAAPAGEVPPPLTSIAVRYPHDLGIGLSGLGTSTCTEATLRASGPYGCPANSAMGRGTAVAAIPVGREVLHETAPLSIFRTPDREGRFALLMYAFGLNPIDAQIVFGGLLLPAPAPFGGTLAIEVPLVASLLGAPDVSVVQLHTTIGPQGLTYYRRSRGRTVAYLPRGILLPDRCPRGGFLFAADFRFADQSRASASARVSCPLKRPARPATAGSARPGG